MYKVNEYQDFHISITGRREDAFGLAVVGDYPNAGLKYQTVPLDFKPDVLYTITSFINLSAARLPLISAVSIDGQPIKSPA